MLMSRRIVGSIVWLWSLAWVSGAGGGVGRPAPNGGQPGEPPAQVFTQQALFESGRDGYHTYRIPALVVTKQGTVLAFCEARKNSNADHGDVDLALRRSVDGGRTWEKMRIVADDGGHTVGNPCPVVDRRTGTVWLPYCRDNKRVLVRKSTTDGRTWSEPADVTADVMSPQWHWVGTGPGHGVQLASGRLLIPCWADATPSLGEIQLSFVFFSDDGGRRWRPGGALDRNASDECEVVERADGSLYMNMRSRQGKQRRAWATSSDGGAAWSAVEYDPALPEPSCQGSLVRLSDRRVHDRDRVLLASPASPKDRTQLTVRMSYDECRTWPIARVVHAGSSAYSDLAVTLGREVLLLYEAENYGKLVLARFNVEWLSNGRDSPAEPIRYSRETRSRPRPLAVHRLTIDLVAKGLELAVSVGEDPDGPGPAEAALTPPGTLARRERFVAAVNANAWTMVPPTPRGKSPAYVAGAASDACGWVQTAAGPSSPPQKGYVSFWLDPAGRGRIGDLQQPVAARCAVSGFRALMREGTILPKPSDTRHPRTALGLDRSGRWLTLLVVDGRRKGYSEGVSERELAELIEQSGCWDALNLDGGGSSILLFGDSPEGLEVMNRPSDVAGPRPVPVMLGLRRR